MEPEGILNGSNTNDRNMNTIAITGKSPAVQSSHQGCARIRSRSRGDILLVDLQNAARGQFSATLRLVGLSAAAAARRREGSRSGLPASTGRSPPSQRTAARRSCPRPLRNTTLRRSQQKQPAQGPSNRHQSSTCRMAKRFLRHFDRADLFHAFLTRLLLFNSLRLRVMSPP